MLNAVLANDRIDYANKTHKVDYDDEIAIANAALDSETVQMIESRYLVSHKNPKVLAM